MFADFSFTAKKIVRREPQMPETADIKRGTQKAISAAIKDEARIVGFDLVGIAPAVSPQGFHPLTEWLTDGHAGEMHYFERRHDAYKNPDSVLTGVRSLVVLGVNYNTSEPPATVANTGRVARYAWGQVDYHNQIRDQLRALATFIHQHDPDCRTRGVVDTAPLLERDFARLAGLGWFGKNTMLINKRAGSWFFLAALLVDVELEYDQPHETSHCGTCERCLEACPTDAFVEPYVLDARRCISYLTIELRDSAIPVDLRQGMGDWLFGCDICQDVCPWNNKAPVSGEPRYQPQADLFPADAVKLLQMNADEFRHRFRDTPLGRPGRTGLLRNAAIVLGNHGDGRAIGPLLKGLHDADPMVRGACIWALGQLGDTNEITALRSRRSVEKDDEVTGEIDQAIAEIASRMSNTISG